MSKLQDPKTCAELTDAVATELHEVWRQGHIKAKGNVPRWKPTTDEAWWKKHTNAAFARDNGGVQEVDINIPFSDLPNDWQAENAAAAEFAVRIVVNGKLLGEPLDVDALSAQIHDAWLTRQRLLPVEPGKVPYYRSAGQDKPYALLSEDEKQKDRDQLAIAERHVNAVP